MIGKKRRIMTDEEKESFKRLVFDREGYCSTNPAASTFDNSQRSFGSDLHQPTTSSVNLRQSQPRDLSHQQSLSIVQRPGDSSISSFQPALNDASLQQSTSKSGNLPAVDFSQHRLGVGPSSSRSPGLHTPPVRDHDSPVQGVFAADDSSFDMDGKLICKLPIISHYSFGFYVVLFERQKFRDFFSPFFCQILI